MTTRPDMNSAKHYTVGWICAVKAERVAAVAFLDENLGVPSEVSKNDNNSYTLGRMGKHYVVIASLPDGDSGTASAASVARDMLHSFPNVRIGLMVGIGGGVPSLKNAIRLGDVVVSSPSNGTGGVVQYDAGEYLQNGTFKETGHLNKPPNFLGTAVTGLSSEHEFNGNGLDEAINSVLQKFKRLWKTYNRPNLEDQLFKSSVVHSEGGRDCCQNSLVENKSKLESREERTEDDDNPAIHYGLIASGNTLIKDAVKRDEIARQRGILCFEREAAGLMNHFPCIVIRGICDYADSHGNPQWIGYASMTAAAYAKSLIGRIPLNSVEAQERIADVVQRSEDARGTVTYTVEEYDPEGETEEIVTGKLLPSVGDSEDPILKKLTKGKGDSEHASRENAFRQS